MKKLMIIMFNLIISIVVFITSAYAWYTNYFGVNATDGNYLASKSGYFESGDGKTQDTAYVISHPRHLYNLAWLQDLGYFDDNTETTEKEVYYFKLKNDLDMSALSKNDVQTPIPPIGIDGHPFISNFDGNGFTINNMIIDTNFSNASYIKPDSGILAQHEQDTISSDTIKTSGVGMFGVVGNEITEADTTTKSETIKNFYIDNTIVKSSVKASVGIIGGIVRNNLNKIGVHYSSIQFNTGSSVRDGKNFSDYALIGEYDENNGSWNGKPGTGFGTTIDIADAYQGFKAVTSSTGDIVFPDGKNLPIAHTDGSYTTASTVNTGYYVGQLKSYVKELKYQEVQYDYNIRLNDNCDLNDVTTIKDAKIAGQIMDILVPKKSIYFVPQVSGNAKFIFYSSSNDNSGYTIYEITRENKEAALKLGENVTIKSRSTGFPNKSYKEESVAVVKGKEYLICGTEESSTVYRGANFLYMDLGANAGTTTGNFTIEKVDFVYLDSQTNKLQDISLDSYAKSNVLFKITGFKENKTEGQIYFRRNKNGSNDIVLYFPSTSDANIAFESVGTGSTGAASNSDCSSPSTTTGST